MSTFPHIFNPFEQFILWDLSFISNCIFAYQIFHSWYGFTQFIFLLITELVLGFLAMHLIQKPGETLILPFICLLIKNIFVEQHFLKFIQIKSVDRFHCVKTFYFLTIWRMITFKLPIPFDQINLFENCFKFRVYVLRHCHFQKVECV